MDANAPYGKKILGFALVVFDGVCQHIPQKAIGSILELSSIRRISFTTPPDRRAAIVEQVKALYSNDIAFKCGDIVGAPGAEDLDGINRMDRINASNPVNPVHPVQTVASLSAAPNNLKILEFSSVRLSAPLKRAMWCMTCSPTLQNE